MRFSCSVVGACKGLNSKTYNPQVGKCSHSSLWNPVFGTTFAPKMEIYAKNKYTQSFARDKGFPTTEQKEHRRFLWTECAEANSPFTDFEGVDGNIPRRIRISWISRSFDTLQTGKTQWLFHVSLCFRCVNTLLPDAVRFDAIGHHHKLTLVSLPTENFNASSSRCSDDSMKELNGKLLPCSFLGNCAIIAICYWETNVYASANWIMQKSQIYVFHFWLVIYVFHNVIWLKLSALKSIDNHWQDSSPNFLL